MLRILTHIYNYYDDMKWNIHIIFNSLITSLGPWLGSCPRVGWTPSPRIQSVSPLPSQTVRGGARELRG